MASLQWEESVRDALVFQSWDVDVRVKATLAHQRVVSRRASDAPRNGVDRSSELVWPVDDAVDQAKPLCVLRREVLSQQKHF